MNKNLSTNRSHAKKKKNASSNNLSSLQVHRGVQMESPKKSHKDAMKKDNPSTNGVSTCGKFILQVHGCL